MKTTGWLFDVYPLGDRVVLWFITPEGEKLRLEDEFPYVLYLSGPKARLRQVVAGMQNRHWVKRVYRAYGRELQSGREIPVLALELRAYAYLAPLRGWLGREAQLECYHGDLDVAAYYLYQRRLHPCAWYELEIEGGRLRGWNSLEDPFAVEFSLPPLSILEVGLTKDPLLPLTAGNGLRLGWEGQTLELEAGEPRTLVTEVARHLRRLDPDVVLSDWGDEEIIPVLWRWSRRYGLALPLDREVGSMPQILHRLEDCAPGRSYFSYGRIVYQGPSLPFYGRWHVDRRNSFFFREAGLAGLVQICRLGQIPLQQAARASPGTLITSMQLARAVADNILIPWRKGEPERFKSAAELLTIDKGGLSFMPPVGLHFGVAELDFASMYPTIMTIHNISPETVNCECCGGEVGEGHLAVTSNQLSVTSCQSSVISGQSLIGTGPVGQPQPTDPSVREVEGRKPATGHWSLVTDHSPTVPEAGFHLCQRREGLVPRTLRPILTLRERLKARATEAPPEQAQVYRERQNALKWMLVTCFGYLGYKNARFGRIEAHEAVTAFGRDKLLTAKEICEAAGFRVLHGLTDCLWVQKEGLTEAELTELCRRVSAATGVKLALEGLYHWIVFLPSRQNPKRPVATRYFGVFSDGRLKVRGLCCRRRDTPPFVRRVQEALLRRLGQAATAAELAALKPELAELAEHYRQVLREGGLPPQELVVTKVLSQPAAAYRVDTATALAVRQLEQGGVFLMPGEKVRFVHRNKGGPKELRVQAAPFLEELEDYDTEVYMDLLNRAIQEVLGGVWGQESNI